ncbi:MAG: YraN family protein [Verrucomicrobia bacterium]|jgi:putative endonuclease|nr:YraN family protein [Verrucomicrobiota bacterium]
MFGLNLKRSIAKGPQHLRTGEWGEAVAAKALKKKGFKILGKRVRVGTRDELDLVARDGEVLVFVEVKTRKSETFGRPAASVDRKKRHTLSRAAVRYLKRLKNPRVCFRFDVVEVVGDMETEAPPTIRHIENAFALERRYQLP